MASTVLHVDRRNDAVAILTLNRPEKRNALTIELMESLCREMESLAKQPTCRIAILHGEGPVFCAGLDLLEAADTEIVEQSAHCVAKMLQTMMESPLVTIAAAQGAANAGGAGLMCACDIVVAADDLQICFPEVRRGLVPALISAVIHDQIGGAHLRELLLLAEPIDAQRALSLGLVRRVAPAKSILQEADRVAATILKGAPHAIRTTKRLLCEMRASRMTELFESALHVHTQARNSEEAREGILAFHERREPVW